MLLREMFDRPVPGLQDIENDNSVVKYYEPRKARLTLKQIRKLRRMNEVRNYEKASSIKKIQAQYGPKPQAGPSL